MKKRNILLLTFLFMASSSNAHAFDSCSSEKESYDLFTNWTNERYANWLWAYYNNPNKSQYYQDYLDMKRRKDTATIAYQECLDRVLRQVNDATAIFNKGYESYKQWRYDLAILYYKEYLNANTDTQDKDNQSAKMNLVLSYKAYGNAFLEKKDWDNALFQYLEALRLDFRDEKSLWGAGLCYLQKDDIESALKYYSDWLKYATNSETIKSLQDGIKLINELKQDKEKRKNAPTNDTLSYLQYYLTFLNVPDAWKKVDTKPNAPVIAIIDDGININHPDLVDTIWIDPSSPYGSSKIKNFAGDSLPDNLPTGDHWTMVAGIIWATQWNSEWIAWIAKASKLMPIRVFQTNGVASSSWIISALEYAIEKNADIINLSLGKSQFSYTSDFDAVIRRAYDKWIAIVIAAGNGDVLTKQTTWVNLDNNPISPVCNNEWSTAFSIGVYASSRDWYRTNWTNYGKCASFMAPWEDIISASVPAFAKGENWKNYDIQSWTSFSAPMITGIIALWYNKYGKIDIPTILDSLKQSTVKFTTANGTVLNKIDASKYIDALDTKLKERKHLDTLRTKTDQWFIKVTRKFNNAENNEEREEKYLNLRGQLSKYQSKLSGDKLFILNYLLQKIQEELNRTYTAEMSF